MNIAMLLLAYDFDIKCIEYWLFRFPFEISDYGKN